MPKRKLGDVYNYFILKPNTDKAICKDETCEDTIKWKSSNLRRHLKTKHPELHTQLLALDTVSPDSAGYAIAESFVKLEPPSDDHETDSEHQETDFNLSDHSEVPPAITAVSPFNVVHCDPLRGISKSDDSLDLLLTKFFIENDIPFKAVKSRYLAKFIEKLRPEYKLPNPNAMKTSILGKIHDEAMCKAKPDDKIAFIKSIL